MNAPLITFFIVFALLSVFFIVEIIFTANTGTALTNNNIADAKANFQIASGMVYFIAAVYFLSAISFLLKPKDDKKSN